MAKRDPMPSTIQNLIRLEHITKKFGKVLANDDITLNIPPASIVALLGENGAGKSTLMSILAGKMQADKGTLYINDKPIRFSSEKDAFRAGIGMVYQHFMLIESMTVTENILLGQQRGLLNRKAMDKHVRDLAKHSGLDIDPEARIENLSMGERQRVEILKLINRNVKVLILDEPTAVLTPPEISQLFEALRRMKAEGKSIIFISHKMHEIIEIADSIAILRKGRIVDTFPRDAIPCERELASRMIGRDMLQTVQASPVPHGDIILETKGLSGAIIRNITLHVRQGEIFAIIGVAGNGQQELVAILNNLVKAKSGTATILNNPLKKLASIPPKPHFIAYIPEDRRNLGTCPSRDLCDNFLLTNRHQYAKHLGLDRKAAEKDVQAVIEKHNVLPPDASALASSFSGGNLQKFLVGREMSRDPRCIIAENPTQGLDVIAMEEVWKELLQSRNTAGILLVTSDLNEALTLADTLAVMYRGEIVDIFSRTDNEKVQNIGLMMAGIFGEKATANCE